VALLRHDGQHVPLGQLTSWLWASPPTSAHSNLRTYATALRKTLNKCAPGLGQRLETRRGSAGGPGAYRLATEPQEVDTSLFVDLANHASNDLAAARPATAAQKLRTSLALWRGPIGEDLPDTLALRSWAGTLTERRIAAKEDLAEAHLALGEHTGLVVDLRNDIAEHPLRERPVELLMRALHASGDRPGAIAAFQDFRVRLIDELGVEPSAHLHNMQLALLKDEPLLPCLPHRRPVPTIN
jgi:DNA-binding SARP family transcriptional activator